ncbi:MAG TPA: response regulator transcription factor [Bacteroidia bacterium]|jgi:two-component system alkaline phosphatase synthesis response regulator PhoP|nr:response regulator transcription factor [Bacteroidia bacterium]
MENARILLVDDEPDVLEFLSFNLKKEGYEVYTACDGRNAIQTAKKVLPNLIVLDVMMPEMDGIEACKELRNMPETKNSFIIFLTARTEDYSQIAGLDAGADDYVSKPIKPRVLVSRIKALLRRSSPADQHTDVMDVGGGISINKESYTVTVGAEELSLPKKEFELLYLLASKPGKVFSREDILHKIWGGDVVVGDRTIDVHIRKLRQKLGEEKIKTLKGIGYKFEF